MANQNQKANITTLYSLKMLYKGVSRKKQYHCFFRGAPKISRKINFYIRLVVEN